MNDKTMEQVVAFTDIHAHCVRDPECPVPGWRRIPTPDQLLAIYDRLGIARGAILPLGEAESVNLQSNEEVLHIAAQHPDRFVPFCSVDARNYMSARGMAPLGEVLKYYASRGARGLGVVCSKLRLNDPLMVNLLAGAESAGLPVTLAFAPAENRLHGVLDRIGLPGLEETLVRFPRLKVIGHSPAFWCEIEPFRGEDPRFANVAGPVRPGGRIPELLRRYANLYCDLSAGCGANAIMRDRDFGIRFLNEFQDRLFFGLDASAPPDEPPPLAAYLRELKSAGAIPASAFEKIACGNARRILGI